MTKRGLKVGRPVVLRRTAMHAAAPAASVLRKERRRAVFTERLARTAAAVAARGRGRGRKAALELSSLEAALDGVDAAAPRPSPAQAAYGAPGKAVVHARSRTRTVAAESARLAAVLEHPTFAADPVAAISHHVRAQMAAIAAPAKQQKKDKARAPRPRSAAAGRREAMDE